MLICLLMRASHSSWKFWRILDILGLDWNLDKSAMQRFTTMESDGSLLCVSAKKSYKTQLLFRRSWISCCSSWAVKATKASWESQAVAFYRARFSNTAGHKKEPKAIQNENATKFNRVLKYLISAFASVHASRCVPLHHYSLNLSV